jgi:hypothetical protein
MGFRSGLTRERIPGSPSLFQYPKAITSPSRREFMNPLYIIAIPLALVVIGMILNSTGLAYDQPPSSQEQDPNKKLAAEKETYRKFFNLQRTRSVTRQKRVGQYSWLVMAAFIGAFIWLYTDTVNKTSLSSRIAGMQTLATEEGKQMVLSVTQSDGTNVKYLIKLPQADKLAETTKAQEAVTKEKVSSWELERLGTALSIGNNSLPNGIALQMSQAAVEAR